AFQHRGPRGAGLRARRAGPAHHRHGRRAAARGIRDPLSQPRAPRSRGHRHLPRRARRAPAAGAHEPHVAGAVRAPRVRQERLRRARRRRHRASAVHHPAGPAPVGRGRARRDGAGDVHPFRRPRGRHLHGLRRHARPHEHARHLRVGGGDGGRPGPRALRPPGRVARRDPAGADARQQRVHRAQPAVLHGLAHRGEPVRPAELDRGRPGRAHLHHPPGRAPPGHPRRAGRLRRKGEEGGGRADRHLGRARAVRLRHLHLHRRLPALGGGRRHGASQLHHPNLQQLHRARRDGAAGHAFARVLPLVERGARAPRLAGAVRLHRGQHVGRAVVRRGLHQLLRRPVHPPRGHRKRLGVRDLRGGDGQRGGQRPGPPVLLARRDEHAGAVRGRGRFHRPPQPGQHLPQLLHLGIGDRAGAGPFAAQPLPQRHPGRLHARGVAGVRPAADGGAGPRAPVHDGRPAARAGRGDGRPGVRGRLLFALRRRARGGGLRRAARTGRVPAAQDAAGPPLAGRAARGRAGRGRAHRGLPRGQRLAVRRGLHRGRRGPHGGRAAGRRRRGAADRPRIEAGRGRDPGRVRNARRNAAGSRDAGGEPRARSRSLRGRGNAGYAGDARLPPVVAGLGSQAV
ncbi:MAG: hypothetical protein AVDCRST_MAG89-4110, partial [uncultured Gemmatimonadetes bacterium]